MSVFDTIASVLAPHQCLSCGREGSLLCSTCITEYHQTLQPQCAGCRRLNEDFSVCRTCRRWLPLTHIFLDSSYEGLPEQLVAEVKFAYRRQGTTSMVSSMKRFQPFLPQRAILCPIPTAPARIRERGFDHAKMLAKQLSNADHPMQVFLRRKTNARQVGATRRARFEHMLYEFEVVHPEKVKGQHVVLVDDVMTTGATLAAAARVLRQAGAKSVKALVFARGV